MTAEERSATGGAARDASLERADSVVVRHFELRWRAPEPCASVTVIAREVERLVGKPLDELKAATLVVEGVVLAGNAGFRVELALDDGSGERRRVLEGVTCDEVSDAAALTVALALDPTLMARQPPEAPDLSHQLTPVVCDPTPCPRLAVPAPCPWVRFAALDPTPRPAARFLGAFGFGATASAGVLPGVAPGAAAVAAAELESWRAELIGGVSASATNASPAGSGRGASFRLWALGVRVCWLPLAPGVGLCLGGDVGRIIGRGYGVDVPAKDDLTWLAGSAGFLGRFQLGESAELGLHADLLAPLHRPVFRLAGENVHSSSLLAVQLAAYAAARF